MDDFCLIDSHIHDNPVRVLRDNWNSGLSDQELSTMLTAAWNYNKKATLVTFFQLRDCHGHGQGKRHQFYRGIRWFTKHHPEQLTHNFQALLRVGYWKDLLCIWPVADSILQSFIIYAFCKQIQQDIISMHNGGTISKASKWAPTEKCSHDRQWGIVSLLCDELDWSPREYRVALSELRRYAQIPERFLCDRSFGEIDFQAVSVKCGEKNDDTFQKYCGKRWQNWKDQKTVNKHNVVPLEINVI